MAFSLFLRGAAATGLVVLAGCGGGGSSPAALEFQSQGGETALPGATRTVQVRVTDSAQAPVANVRVDFGPSAGSGSVSPSSAMTDDSGIARTAWTLGAVGGGVQSLEARTMGLAPTQLSVNVVGLGFQAQGLGAFARQNIQCASSSQVTPMPAGLCDRPLTELKIEFRGTLQRSGMGQADFALRCADRQVALASLLGSDPRTVTVTWLQGAPANVTVNGVNAGTAPATMLPALQPGSITLQANACGADNFHFADIAISEISFWAR